MCVVASTLNAYYPDAYLICIIPSRYVWWLEYALCLCACAFSRISRHVNTASRRVGGLYQEVWTAVLSYFRLQVDEMAGGWSDEAATRALIEVWGDTKIQSQLDGVQRNRTICDRL